MHRTSIEYKLLKYIQAITCGKRKREKPILMPRTPIELLRDIQVKTCGIRKKRETNFQKKHDFEEKTSKMTWSIAAFTWFFIYIMCEFSCLWVTQACREDEIQWKVASWVRSLPSQCPPCPWIHQRVASLHYIERSCLYKRWEEERSP